ncbi:hypothetical protein [Gallibacterium anatis]
MFFQLSFSWQYCTVACRLWRETDHVKTILTEIFSVNYSGFQFKK